MKFPKPKVSSVVALAVVIGVVSAFFSSGIFKIDQVEMRGNNYVSEDLFSEWTASLSGTHFVWAYLKLLREAPKAHFSQISESKIVFSFPNKLTVDLMEKTAWVSFLDEGKSVIISRDGSILGRGERNYQIDNLDDLILIKGQSDSFFVNDKIRSMELAHITLVIDKVKRHFVGKTIHLEFAGNGLILYLDDTIPIQLGAYEKIEEKFQLLTSFLTYSKKKSKLNFRYIDLRVPDRVIVSYES
ncbi:MAG: cell division septal protein FtsQ [Candidatus Marinamargulisbacteria bacterium]|jgi:cell division septal protein FtsQ